MPNTILKRWNGSTFEELYPKTTVTQISASGSPGTGTVLAGNGAWVAANGHSHGNIDLNGAISSTTVTPANDDRILIADASATTFGKIERGIIIGTSTTTFLANDGQWRTPSSSGYTLPAATASTLGGIEIGFTSTETNRAVLLSANDAYITLPRQIPAVTLNNAATNTPNFYAPTTVGTSGQFLRSNGTSTASTWQDTTAMIGTSSAINSSTDYTVSVTGFRLAIVAIYRDATTKVAEYIVNLNNTDEFNATTRNFRYIWNDGTSTFANLLQVQSSSGLRLRHGSGGTMIFRVSGVR
jgi:hypothetical protein